MTGRASNGEQGRATSEGRHFIGGRWAPSVHGGTFETVDPATEDVIAQVARGDRSDVDAAVQASHQATTGEWRETHPAERGRLLSALARLIERDAEQLARLETLDMGRPLKDSLKNIAGVVKVLDYNAGAADKIEGATIPVGSGHIDFTLFEPLGVTAHIVPWNAPLAMTVRSVAPALAVGCTAVVKPAEQSPLSVLQFARLVQEAGFPDGVLNVVNGFGSEVGQPLVEHPLVRGVTFTGSVRTGREVMRAAADGIKPVILELGGKSPLLVFPDADLDHAVARTVAGILNNSGQVCVASSRLLVHKDIKREFLDRLTAVFESMRLGPGLENPDLGPLVSREHHAQVLEHLEGGRRQGARVVTGGKRPAEPSAGFFVEPTIFDGVSNGMTIAQEEIFGPVLAVIEFDEETEAVEIANDVPYGLAAGVFTKDIDRAMRIVRELQAGIVWVNDWFVGGAQAPVGGYKHSGIGRERGLVGLRNYVQTKSVGIRVG